MTDEQQDAPGAVAPQRLWMDGGGSSARREGRLMIIGGSEERTADGVILRTFVEMAGGADARIVVLGTATSIPEEVGPMYVDTFTAIGVDKVTFLPLAAREEANDPATVALVEEATGVFFTGGDQLRIATVVGGSHTDTALHARFRDGLVIAGTSAGAAMMSSTMILGGYDTVPSTATVRTGVGLGFVSGVVIDMHFAERGRLSRLLTVVGLFPHEIGLGIDEDTAAVVEGSRFRVIGSGAVTVVDAGEVTSLHAPRDGEEGRIAMTGVLLHVLPAGYEFDLSTRVPVIVSTPDGARPRGTGG